MWTNLSAYFRVLFVGERPFLFQHINTPVLLCEAHKEVVFPGPDPNLTTNTFRTGVLMQARPYHPILVLNLTNKLVAQWQRAKSLQPGSKRCTAM